MASTLQQTTEFPEDITQFDLNDPIEGGPDGIDNEPHKQLAARTNWLRRKLESETRQIIVNDAEGVPHYMVWIPRIILPAGALGTGIPSQDLYLGGFAVDQFLCAVEDGKAVSHPLKMPKNLITLTDAQTAAAARVIEGAACEVMSAKDWGHLAWLIDLIGHPLEGNIAGGAYPGKEEWDGRGEPGVAGPHIGISGPSNWYHNGLSNGIKDLVGNRFHMLPLKMSQAEIILEFSAVLANSISDSDPSIDIIDSVGAPQGPFHGWPRDGAVWVVLNDGVNLEYFDYATLTVDDEDTTHGLLGGCVRGSISDAHAFEAGTPLTITVAFWAIADAWGARLDGAVGDQITDTEVTLKAWPTPWSSAGTPEVGDVLSIDDEDLLVTDVDGLVCQVQRGANGTSIATHVNLSLVYRYSSELERTALHSQIGFASGALRTGLLEEYYIRHPGPTESLSRIRYEIGGSDDLLCRGGASIPFLPQPEGGMAEVVFPGVAGPIIGPGYTSFRCVWRPTFD